MRVRPRPSIVAALLLFGLLLGSACNKKPFAVRITSPAHGIFTTAPSVTVTGFVEGATPATAVVIVNGAFVTVQPNLTWSTSVPLDPAIVFNPVMVIAVNTATGEGQRQRIVVISGDSVADGSHSLNSLALRLTDGGLDSVEPEISTFVDLDIATLLPVGTPVISDFCAVDGGFFGCLGSVDVYIANPPPTFSTFGLDVDSMTNFAAGDVAVNDIQVDLDIDGSGLAPSCGLRITASQALITGDYSLDPDAGDPTLIDVNLLSTPGVSFSNFQDEFTSGICDFPLLGSLVQLIIGDVQPIVSSGLADFLADPDGGGPLDAPIAEGIETALAEIQITGPIGESLGLSLEAPMFDIFVDDDGLTLGSDARITSTPCTPPPGAPDFGASYHVPEAFPSFGATTPTGGLPYGLGICISTSAFNQLLKAEVECGLLQLDLTEIDLGFGLVPVTAGVLGLIIPEFATFDPALEFTIKIIPSLAPVLTGNAGPSGELAELRIGGLNVELRETVSNFLTLWGQVDFRAGLDFSFDNMTSELVPSITNVAAEDLTIDIVHQTINTHPAEIANLIGPLLPQVLPTLGSSLGSFPLPAFLGLGLQGVAVEQNGEFVSLFVDLVSAP